MHGYTRNSGFYNTQIYYRFIRGLCLETKIILRVFAVRVPSFNFPIYLFSDNYLEVGHLLSDFDDLEICCQGHRSE